MKIGFYRHGPTAWNAEKRLQGRTDIGLTDAARDWLNGHRLPPEFHPTRTLASPLSRAVETARILAPGKVEQEPRLIETNWGAWEGQTIADLRRADPAGMAEAEDRGLDLRPPGGESPRDVRLRLAGLFESLAGKSEPEALLAVTHKGVIRAAMSLATGWDFTGKPPVKLDWQCLHIFDVGPEGQLSMTGPNIPLAGRS